MENVKFSDPGLHVAVLGALLRNESLFFSDVQARTKPADFAASTSKVAVAVQPSLRLWDEIKQSAKPQVASLQ